jgi:hypothetical protein
MSELFPGRSAYRDIKFHHPLSPDGRPFNEFAAKHHCCAEEAIDCDATAGPHPLQAAPSLPRQPKFSTMSSFSRIRCEYPLKMHRRRTFFVTLQQSITQAARGMLTIPLQVSQPRTKGTHVVA